MVSCIYFISSWLLTNQLFGWNMVKKKKSIKKSEDSRPKADPNASLWGWGDEEDVVASGENQVFIFVRFFIINYCC